MLIREPMPHPVGIKAVAAPWLGRMGLGEGLRGRNLAWPQWLADARLSVAGLGRAAPHVALPHHDNAMALALAGLMAVILYVATMALLLHFTLSHIAQGFDVHMHSAMTVEILPDSVDATNTASLEARAHQVEARLEKIAGIRHVERVGKEKISQLLQPWLGGIAVPDSLPLPLLLDVRLNQANHAGEGQKFAALLTKALAGIAGVVVDDHASLLQDLTHFVESLQEVAAYVVALSFGAMLLVAYFAAQTTFYINRDLVEILHLIGAEDGAIAQHTGIYVLYHSLAAALMALTAALITLVGLWLSGHGVDISFLPNFAIGSWEWLLLFGQWVLFLLGAVLLCLLTSRFTVLRALRRLT